MVNVFEIQLDFVLIAKIDAKNRDMIKEAIEERLATQPEAYGKPLRRTLKGYWKLRVGDYRVVFKVSSNTIFVFGIIHRKEGILHLSVYTFNCFRHKKMNFHYLDPKMGIAVT